MRMKTLITLLLGLAFQLAQVLPGMSAGAPCAAAAACQCQSCAGGNSCCCMKSGQPDPKPAPQPLHAGDFLKGMAMKMPPTTMKQCMTKKDMAPKPEKQEKGQECKMKDQKVTGDTVTYTMECKTAEGSMTTSGKMTYKGDAFDGTTNTTMKTKGQPDMFMTSKMTGKYNGPCPKEK